MAMADGYDTRISRRVYKEVRVIHFDPDVLAVFMEARDTMQNIAERDADNESQ